MSGYLNFKNYESFLLALYKLSNYENLFFNVKTAKIFLLHFRQEAVRVIFERGV